MCCAAGSLDVAPLTRLTSLFLGDIWACFVIQQAWHLPHLAHVHLSFSYEEVTI